MVSIVQNDNNWLDHIKEYYGPNISSVKKLLITSKKY